MSHSGMKNNIFTVGKNFFGIARFFWFGFFKQNARIPRFEKNFFQIFVLFNNKVKIVKNKK